MPPPMSAELPVMVQPLTVSEFAVNAVTNVPAGEMKIDRSLIRSFGYNRSDLIMVQSTISLAQSLGRKVVAEGVEDVLSLEQLSSMGCDLAQGFIIGRPMSLAEIQRRLDRERKRAQAA